MDEGCEEPSVKCLEQSGVGVLANVYLKPLSCDVNSLPWPRAAATKTPVTSLQRQSAVSLLCPDAWQLSALIVGADSNYWRRSRWRLQVQLGVFC